MTTPLVWDHLTCDGARPDRLAAALAVTPALARLLCLRGLDDPEAAARFLRPSLSDLHDPEGLTGMRTAVERLLAAIARGERIAVHGDYDVDGVTSTVIVRRALELLGADVTHFIPDRLRDGYGLQPGAIDRLHAEGVKVVVSVDCGIRGVEAAQRARALGMDLIVTDHHEPEPVLPPALAVINPKRPDCTYPDKNLAGVGVALKLVQALCRRQDRDRWLPAFVKIAAIGTLADVVPLVGENRVIAKIGLELLSRGPHKVGLRALIEGAGLAGRTIDAYHVAFMLAPRVNAAGRMSTPDLATRLLLAADDAMEADARALAGQLNAENEKRQREELEIFAQARTRVERDIDVGARCVLVVDGDNWHRGVIGIVASKLVETFYRPAIVLSHEDGVAHGSCRSISRFDMLAALEHCAPLLLRYGGHKAAAGLALDSARVGEFRSAINAYAEARLEPDDLKPRLRIDAPLAFRAIRGELISDLALLAPFGCGNPKPVFHAAGVEVVDGPRILKDHHLKLAVRQDGRTFRAIAWRAADRARFIAEHRQALDLAFSLDQNSFNGETFVELTVADVRAVSS